MSGDPFILDPAKLGEILEQVGFGDALNREVARWVARLPLDDTTKANIMAQAEDAIGALVNQFGQQILDGLRAQVQQDVLKALTTGKSEITDDPTSLA